MATKLEKDVTRESTSKADDKEIMITITAKQTINLKLKGMRSGSVEVSIADLYGQLTNKPTNNEESNEVEEKAVPKNKYQKVDKKNPMLSLIDLRSHNVISTLDIPTMAKFDHIIKSLMDAN
jgi:predicted acetyltransferase